MTTYTDVFGSDTVPPSEYSYKALTIAADTTLTWAQTSEGANTTAKLLEVTASVAGLTLTLPDATEVSTGEDILIRNVGAETFSVVSSTGSAVVTVASGTAKYIYVTDNTTADGAWALVAFGVGSSSVDAASLVGYGLMASGSTLNTAHPVYTAAAGFAVDATYRAKLINFTGGADTLTFAAAATLGNNFFTLIRNSGTGSLILDPSGVETIDGQAYITLQPSESVILCCSGTSLFTVGYGRSVSYNFTQLVLDVSAGGTFTLSSAQAANKLLTFIGNPASGVTVEVPSVVAVYYILSSISTAQTITVKTSAGTGSAIAQGVRAILICDATDVYSAQSATASTTLQLLDGSVTTPALSFASQTNTGLYKYSTTGFGLAVDGVARITDDGTTTTIGALSGLVKRTSGAESAAVAGTDYVAPGGALGTPASGTLTNCTGLPIAGVIGGAASGANSDITSLTGLTGNLTFTGTGNRITGDFSNATVADRVMFQTSVVNDSTNIAVVPNGSGTVSRLNLFNVSDLSAGNYSVAQVSIGATEFSLISTKSSTGSYLPMAFYTGGSERMRIDTSGNVLAVSAGGSLGYGAGAGGTVTQATSKSTAVTLNKPTGQITMHSASLAANTAVSFQFNNSLLSGADLVVMNIYNNATTNAYLLQVQDIRSGYCTVSLRNLTAGALAEAVMFQYAIIKGSAS